MGRHATATSASSTVVAKLSHKVIANRSVNPPVAIPVKMKGALLALSAVGSVAAQHITFPAYANVVAAIDPSDPEYTACSAANDLLEYCVQSAGGPDAVETVDPSALLNCACCLEGTPISPAFSVCSTYLRTEAPSYTSEYSGKHWTSRIEARILT